MSHDASEGQLCTEQESELTFLVRSDDCEFVFMRCGESALL